MAKADKSTSTRNGDANDCKLEGNTLSLKVTVDPKGRPSASGKTKIHFTTSGYKEIPGTPYRLSLTVIGPKD